MEAVQQEVPNLNRRYKIFINKLLFCEAESALPTITLSFIFSDESFTSELCLTKGDTPKACQFPYMLKGSERTKCVYQNRRFECPTRLDKAREPLPGSWRECKDNCAGESLRHFDLNTYTKIFIFDFATLLTDICLAKSIHFNGSLPCVFPFKYEGQDYNGCVPPRLVDRLYSGAKPWCPPLTRESEYYNLTLRAECDSNCYKVSLIIGKYIA